MILNVSSFLFKHDSICLNNAIFQLIIFSMVREFQYAFGELDICSSDIEELMGFDDGVIPDPFPELIEHAINSAPSHSKIRGGYKIFSSDECSMDMQSIRICDQVFNPSKIVITQFKNAMSFGLFICTAGSEISQHAKELSASGDPLLSFVFDVIGSVAVEKATDKVQKSMEAECLKSGLTISDRYSPGYCDWSVSEQQKLFDLMPAGFCGVSLSETSLMSPIKSVSGIIAIGHNLKQKGYQCYWCAEKNCIYGKIRRQKKI